MKKRMECIMQQGLYTGKNGVQGKDVEVVHVAVLVDEDDSPALR